MDYFDWYAAYLHRTCPVVDGHRDLVTEIYRRRLKGERGILNQYYKKEFQKSGVNFIFASLFLGTDELENCKENGVLQKGAVLKKTMEMLAAFYADLEETKGRVQLVTDRDSLVRMTTKRGLSKRQKVGVLLYLEGLDMLEGEPEVLRCFYVMGVRGAALTWNVRPEFPEALAEGCRIRTGIFEKEDSVEESFMKNGNSSAITDKGVQALFLMEELGIFVDSSHLSRRAAWILPAFTKKPFAATHSNAEALLAHPRNLTDGEIKEIAERGGVIGANAYRKFVRQEKSEQPDTDALCDQIVYLLAAAGENHVGLGLDLGEGNILADYRDIPAVTANLLRRGLSIETVKKVLGGNWIRYLSAIFE